VLATILGLLVMLVAGCGGSSDASAESGIPDSPPEVELPPNLPPKKLVVKDLSKGSGAMAEKGDEVALQYFCIDWASGTEYSNSWKYPSPPTFVLGEHIRLQRGLNLAVPGMREGGAREVQIPSTLLYYPGVPHSHVRRLDSLLCKVYLVEVIAKSHRR
jgi:hypothetical protein